MPWASTTRWRFVPCLPRSVGFLPVSWPPRGRHRGGVQRGPVPVDAIGLGQLFEKHLVQPAPDARLVPVSQPAPARHPAPTPHLGRQVLPGDARLQHEQDPRQRRPVRHPGPSALGLRRLRREQRRDPRPQRIRQQFLRHGTLLHGSYSASLAAYATVLLGVLSTLIRGKGVCVAVTQDPTLKPGKNCRSSISVGARKGPGTPCSGSMSDLGTGVSVRMVRRNRVAETPTGRTRREPVADAPLRLRTPPTPTTRRWWSSCRSDLRGTATPTPP
jgi:hypothetical protein